MTGGNQTIDNRVDHVVMSGEKFATGGRDLNADLVLRRDERTPGFGHVRLTGHRREQAIDHRAHDARICLIILDRVGIVDGVNDRRRRTRRCRLRHCLKNGATRKKRYAYELRQTLTNLWPTLRITTAQLWRLLLIMQATRLPL